MDATVLGAEVQGHDAEVLDHDVEVLDHDAEVLDHDAEVPYVVEVPCHDVEVPYHDVEVLCYDAEVPCHDAEVPCHAAEVPCNAAEVCEDALLAGSSPSSTLSVVTECYYPDSADDAAFHQMLPRNTHKLNIITKLVICVVISLSMGWRKVLFLYPTD